MGTPSIVYESIKRTHAVASGPPRWKFPLPASCPIQFAAYAFDQNFEMLLSSFPPAQKNSPATVFAGLLDANAILTGLSQPVPTGAGKGNFTASFARVPASWDDFQTQNVNFPGWINTITGAAGFRDPLPRLVTVRMHYDYFVIDPTGLAAGVVDSGETLITKKTVLSKGSIPILPKTPWLAMYSATGVAPWAAIPNDEAKSLVPAAGVQGYYPTLPSIEQYKSWCAVAAAFVATWDSTHPPVWGGASSIDVSSGQYQLDDSKLIDYEGNIVARVTPYVMPK